MCTNGMFVLPRQTPGVEIMEQVTPMTEGTHPAGINTPAVTQWLLGHVRGLAAPFAFQLVAGGRSNLTFQVTDAAGRRVILRRPPMSHVLSTAHDMGREYRIISALQATPVPVPTALAYCDDEAVNGRPFYVMDFVDGHILRDAAQTQAALDERTRQAAGEDLVNVLVALHQVDIDVVGLGGLARREGYIERQLRRWHGQFQQSQQQAREAGVYQPVPLVDEVHQQLAGRVPAQRGAAIVHGDYRLDNTVLSAAGRVAGVLDWELCTLGDPLADLGTFLMYWARPATELPGFPSTAQLATRYAAGSGADLTDLGYYLAFAHWKLACIMAGVYVRYAAHAMGVGDAEDAAELGASIQENARLAQAALRPA
ncbi:MAG TPA: phosphotransferase family protein [Streptosporangiaceae bacterium]|nr:phosphotransferase family protein [Streptosporangiaceae bacterium]